MSITENKSIAIRFAGIWGKEPLDIIDELASPDITVHYPIMPQTFHSRDIFKRVMTAFRRAFPDSEMKLDDIIAEGEKVVVRWTFSGAYAADFLGFKASGKKVAWTGITVYTIVKGKVIEERGEEDFLGFLRQIGFVPPLPGR